MATQILENCLLNKLNINNINNNDLLHGHVDVYTYNTDHIAFKYFLLKTKQLYNKKAPKYTCTECERYDCQVDGHFSF